MPASYVKEVGFVVNSSAGTTSAITVAAGGVPIGDSVVLLGSCDNTGTNGAATTITVTDTRSNTWTTRTPQALQDTGAASAGIQTFLVTSIITTALQAADTITVTYGNSTTAKSINAQQFTGTNKTTLILTGTYSTDHDADWIGTNLAATPTVAGQVVVVAIGTETPTTDSYTPDSDTTNGSWVNLTRRGTGTGTSAITLNSAYKIVTASGAQNYFGNYDFADYASLIAVLDIDLSTPTPTTVTAAAVVNAPPTIYPPNPLTVTSAAVVNAPAAIKRGATAFPDTVTGAGVVNAPGDLLFDKIIFPETVDAG